MKRINLLNRAGIDLEFIRRLFSYMKEPIEWENATDDGIVSQNKRYKIFLDAHVCSLYIDRDAAPVYYHRSYYAVVRELLTRHCRGTGEESTSLWRKAITGAPVGSLTVNTPEEVLEYINFVSERRFKIAWELRRAHGNETATYSWVIFSPDSPYSMGITEQMLLDPIMDGAWSLQIRDAVWGVSELLYAHSQSILNGDLVEVLEEYGTKRVSVAVKERESMAERVCENCIYSHRIGDEGYRNFQCRRFPPAVVDFACLHGAYPDMRATDWCGEFSDGEGGGIS